MARIYKMSYDEYLLFKRDILWVFMVYDLKPIQRLILIEHCIKLRTAKQIAKMCNKSESRILQIEDNLTYLVAKSFDKKIKQCKMNKSDFSNEFISYMGILKF